MSMYQNEIRERLEALYLELAEVMEMTEQQACTVHNVDCKAEIIEMLEEEIQSLPDEDTGYDYTDDELEAERSTLCRSLGLRRYC